MINPLISIGNFDKKLSKVLSKSLHFRVDKVAHFTRPLKGWDTNFLKLINFPKKASDKVVPPFLTFLEFGFEVCKSKFSFFCSFRCSSLKSLEVLSGCLALLLESYRYQLFHSQMLH